VGTQPYHTVEVIKPKPPLDFGQLLEPAVACKQLGKIPGLRWQIALKRHQLSERMDGGRTRDRRLSQEIDQIVVQAAPLREWALAGVVMEQWIEMPNVVNDEIPELSAVSSLRSVGTLTSVRVR
jgi:hypothetical protein